MGVWQNSGWRFSDQKGKVPAFQATSRLLCPPFFYDHNTTTGEVSRGMPFAVIFTPSIDP